jgi:hypothetical protein
VFVRVRDKERPRIIVVRFENVINSREMAKMERWRRTLADWNSAVISPLKVALLNYLCSLSPVQLRVRDSL